jgi:hypothetical protein
MPIYGTHRKKVQVLGKTVLQIKNTKRSTARKEKIPVGFKKRDQKIFFQRCEEFRIFPIHAMSLKCNVTILSCDPGDFLVQAIYYKPVQACRKTKFHPL